MTARPKRANRLLTIGLGAPKICAMNYSKIIDDLGGTSAVAKLCNVRQPSVSEWRKEGIPAARLMYLQAVRPDVFVSASQKTPEQSSS